MNKLAVFSLLIAQVALAINWYAISAVYSAISVDLKLDVSGLGLITSAFIASIGLFQVPAGILAAKVGPRKVAIWGTIVASVASALTGFAPNLFVIAALRFVSGIGMAAIPASVMMLAARLFRKGSEQILTCDVTGSCSDTIFTAPSAVDCSVTFTADTNFVGTTDYIISQFIPTSAQAIHELPPQFYVANGGDVAGYTFTGSANQVVIFFSDADGASMSLNYQLTAICPSS